MTTRWHLIVDFSYIYYKYYFTYKSGRLKRLTCIDPCGDGEQQKDVTMIYHCLNEIESFRRTWEKKGVDVSMSICFDSKSFRKEQAGGEEYKSGRTHRFVDEDFENMDRIRNMLHEAGYTVYKVDGYEADDLVNMLVRKYKDKFDYTVIYTVDKDLMVNLDRKVGICRYKASKGYFNVTVNNFEDYMEVEMGVRIPYNAITLYLSTVGDASDKIKGIYKFGGKAFVSLCRDLADYNVDFSQMVDDEYTETILNMACSHGLITKSQLDEAMISFNLVKYYTVDAEIAEKLESPLSRKSTSELRANAYMPYYFKSLIE